MASYNVSTAVEVSTADEGGEVRRKVSKGVFTPATAEDEVVLAALIASGYATEAADTKKPAPAAATDEEGK